MKRTLTLTALLMAGTIPAMAADLPVKAPPPIAAPILIWNGFYAGFNGGYSFGRSSRELNFVTPAGGAIIPPGGVISSGGTELEGGLFGGQIGYNWQSSPNWVWGFETDIQWANQRGSRTFLCNGLACLPGLTFLPPGVVGSGAVIDQKLEWFGTFRGRGGFLVTPTALLYATGGLAYGSVQTGVLLTGNNAAGAPISTAFSGSNTRVGWTVGGGVEWKFARNWSGKLEYLYMDLGNTSNTAFLTTAAGVGIGANITSRVTDNIIRAGVNYQFATW
jgi:outer membrane immunogenic protein